jgi:hypothetical protein
MVDFAIPDARIGRRCVRTAKKKFEAANFFC